MGTVTDPSVTDRTTASASATASAANTAATRPVRGGDHVTPS
ncbi:hypothetical protein [Rhodococcus sp. NPDC058639]